MKKGVLEISLRPAAGQIKTQDTETALQRLLSALAPLLSLAISVSAILVALVEITRNDLEAYPVPLLAGLCVVLELLFIDVYRQHSRWDFQLLIVSALSLVFLLVLHALPEYVTGLQLNAVIHRSIFSIIFLLAAALPALVASIYYLLGATPRAEDLSRYPLLLIPPALIISLYFILIWQLVLHGYKTFDWSILLRPYFHTFTPEKYYILGDWPAWRVAEHLSLGIQNQVLGTGLLILLTSAISVPIGVGTGLYLSEYGSGWFGSFIRFITGSLRAISLLVLALAALTLANLFDNTPLEGLFRGTFNNGLNTLSSPGGSYLTASIILSILVIPVIVQVTEQGCRSLPPDLREGSLALGVSEETTLRRIIFPWALPNIITGWLLGCAEAAGCMTVLLFLAPPWHGDNGVGIFKQVTSLAYLVWDIYYGEPIFKSYMQTYQFEAGLLLLLITLVLGILSMLTKDLLGKKFRGG